DIGQVHQSLFSPDLVRESLLGDPGGEVRDAAKVVDLAKVVDSGPAPSVSILSQNQNVQSDLIKLSIRVTDRGKGVGRIEWRVNGVTARVTAKVSSTGPQYSLTEDIALDPGVNEVEVVSYNASNLLASPPARSTFTFAGPADKMKPKLHILAIGINKYLD